MLNTQLVEFLEKQPDEKYNYLSTDCCVAAQFNKSIGRVYPLAKALHESESPRPQSFDARLEKAARAQPWNFGAVLERYKALETV